MYAPIFSNELNTFATYEASLRIFSKKLSLLQHVKISKSDRSSIIIFPGKCYAILIPKFCFQYSEFLDSVLTKGANIFKSFDFKLEGDFSLPRNTFNLFHYDQFFLIGGLVPMTFGKMFFVSFNSCFSLTLFLFSLIIRFMCTC